MSYWAEKQPDRAAVIFETDVITWAELDQRTNQLARAYENLGVKQDDFVTIALPNSIEFVEACFAAWKLGATPQPISSKSPRIERDAIIKLAEPSLVIGVNELGNCVSQLGDNVSSIAVEFHHDINCSKEPLDERIASTIKAMTSGGSTGCPKLIAMQTPAVFELGSTSFNLPYQSVVLVPGPLYHNGPFVFAFYALCQGNSLILERRFDAERTLELVEKHRVESLYQVPTMMHRIWQLPTENREKYDLSSLKALWHLAAACPAWLKDAFIEWLGAEVIWELYGGTEGQGRTIISGREWLTHRGSVGRPHDCEMKILDDEGNEVDPGEIGEIYMRPSSGRAVYKYVGAESTCREDGWDTLGDMGYMDEDGYLYLADRRTDLIVSGGVNIYPAEVEAAIDSHPGVRASAVIGLPDEDMGSVVHAIVDVSDQRVSEEDLLAFLAERLARHKQPRSIEFVNESLRDEAGKLRRKSLREARLAESAPLNSQQ